MDRERNAVWTKPQMSTTYGCGGKVTLANIYITHMLKAFCPVLRLTGINSFNLPTTLIFPTLQIKKLMYQELKS